MASYTLLLSSTILFFSCSSLSPLRFIYAVTYSCSSLSPRSPTPSIPGHSSFGTSEKYFSGVLNICWVIWSGHFQLYHRVLSYSLNMLYQIILSHTCNCQSLRFLHQLNGSEMISHHHIGTHLLSISKLKLLRIHLLSSLPLFSRAICLFFLLCIYIGH